tara:strand:- start:1190 stop:1411 length:222 start_codon:yes stop_codon:yes gene_type:complete
MKPHQLDLSHLSTKDLGLVLLGLSGLNEPIVPAAFKELSPKDRQRVKQLYLAIKTYALESTKDYSAYPSYPVP